MIFLCFIILNPKFSSFSLLFWSNSSIQVAKGFNYATQSMKYEQLETSNPPAK